MTLARIKAAIPHREPFLLLDEIVEQSDQRIVCRKQFTGDEFWYRGHYPQQPITPGVLLCEAAMQAGAVLLAKHVIDAGGGVPVATRANNVQFKLMVAPGDTIEIETELVERLANAFYMKSRITLRGKVACRLEFACTLAASEFLRSLFTYMTTDFLQLAGRRIAVFGVANRKSVAYHVGQTLCAAGVEVVYIVRSPQRKAAVAKILDGAPIYTCDVERQAEIDALAAQLAKDFDHFHGLLHSIAFADYDAGGVRPFHETSREQLLRTFDVSCYSLIALANALKAQLTRDASVVTISISTTRMASENYGFMAPVKAALDSSLAFLAKSFSQFSEIRFNAVAPGLLKTSASAGIPGYVDSYLFAERAALRGRAVATQEVANVAAFLLSPRSSGVNAQRIVVDAGMEVNYFDQRLVRPAVEGLPRSSGS